VNRLPDQNDDAAVEAWTNAKLDVLEEWDARFVARNQDEIGASLDYGWREIDIARGATVGTSPQDFHKVLSDRLDGKPPAPPKPSPDIEPLRKLLATLNPQLADFVHLPPFIPGQTKHPKPREYDSVERAIEDVRRIRRIWKLKFKKVRRERGRVTPEQIAAKRHGVTLKNLRSRMHPGAPKPIGSRRKSAPHTG
jgi:hypothetical protein